MGKRARETLIQKNPKHNERREEQMATTERERKKNIKIYDE